MLTDFAITKTKPDPTREQRLADGEGLHLAVLPAGQRFWRWDYTYDGRRKQLSFGKYPVVTLKRAREKKLEAQRLLDQGMDPSVLRRHDKAAVGVDTFRAVAIEWLEKEARTLGKTTVAKKRSLVERYLVPALGALSVSRIRPIDVLNVLRPIDRLSKYETAHRVRQVAGEIFRFAIATQRALTDPSAHLTDALTPVQVRHHPALIEPKAVGQLLTAIDHADGSPFVCGALRLAPLLFVRPGELRLARWTEFDLDAAMWRIPAARMKVNTGVDHLVPLARQAVAILRDLQAIAGKNALVFPGLKHATRPISNATLPTVLRRLNYTQAQQSMHGFRTLAATHLRELGYDNDLVELQLAHQIANPVRAAYDRAARVPERIAMMQAYADHLDGLKTGTVVAFVPREARGR